MRQERGRFIDLDSWKRRQHFELFRHAAYPYFSVTVDMDVTPRWLQSQGSTGPSFFLSCLFALLRSVNACEPMRMRLRGDGVWLHEQVGIGTPILRANDTFCFGRFDPTPNFSDFERSGRETIARVKATADINPMEDQDDLVYHSTLPWLRFTSFTNALSGHDSIPRLTFGRVSAEGARFQMPVAVAVHHALADGLDVARFVERLQAEMSEELNVTGEIFAG
jgi:chloramphenicol O-acetyltransferase type A